MNFRVAFFGAFAVTVLACNNPDDKNVYEKKASVVDSTSGPKKIKDIEPRLWEADSLQILYYDNPDGDSIRYTRFFSFTETNDSIKVNKLLNELDQVFVQQNNTRNCRSEGKLFLLNKEDVLKTIYFSTRGDTCSYLYFIKDGSFIYFPLSENAKTLLAENKKWARKP